MYRIFRRFLPSRTSSLWTCVLVCVVFGASVSVLILITESSHRSFVAGPSVLIPSAQPASRNDCLPLHFSEKPLPVTLLVSFVGSGNTWTRHLLQQMTGIYTGAVYNDTRLFKAFPGEGRVDGSVIAIKSHAPEVRTVIKITQPIKRVILLLRHPFEATRSTAYQYVTKNHTAVVPAQILMESKEKWIDLVKGHLYIFKRFYYFWLNKKNINLHIVFYDNLKNNLIRELKRLAQFLDVDVNEELLQCVARNSKGSFKRQKPGNHSEDILWDILGPDLQSKIHNVWHKVIQMAKQVNGQILLAKSKHIPFKDLDPKPL